MIDFTDRASVAGAIQYTNVSPDLTRDGVVAHLTTCVRYGFHAAMIGPCWVPVAVDVLRGTEVRIASTLNFPQANDTLAMKLAALRELARAGAHEFDFPPNPGYLVGGMEAEYAEEMREIAAAAHAEGLVVKAMLEFGFLNAGQKARPAWRARRGSTGSSNRADGGGAGSPRPPRTWRC